MDIVHHAAIGMVGFTVLASQDQELAGIGFVVGSVFPDLDVALIAAGKRFYLKQHQGPTHSLLLAPLFAAVFAVAAASQVGWSWALFVGILLGLCLHVGLDLFNTFGIQLGWPATGRRFCFDAVFFIDAVAWALTLGALCLIALDVAVLAVAASYGALVVLYFAAKLALQRVVKRELGVDFAIPSAWNPFAFYIFKRRGGRLETGIYDALSRRTARAESLAESPPEAMDLARRSPVFLDMQSIVRGLHITRVERQPAGTLLVAQDLAVRNFGGKFGRTELRFDSAGNLLHEMAHI